MKCAVLLIAMCVPFILHAASPQVDVLAYRADLSFDVNQESITGSAQLLLTNSSEVELTCIPLDLVGMTVMTVEVEGIAVPWTHDFGALRVFPSQPLRYGDTLSLRVEYGGMPLCPDGRGPVFGPVSYCLPQSKYCDYLCMTSHWLPINNVMYDLATWDLIFTVEEGFTVASIGLLVDQASSNGQSRFRWVETIPTPPQAVTWSIADYACVRDTIMGIPAEYYVLKQDRDRAKAYFSPVAEMIATYSAVLGPWPAEKIGFCWTPEGGVEGQGMIPVHIPSWTVNAGMQEAHDLAHQWFGNSVVPTSIIEGWLSDGFATYMAWLYRSGRETGGDMDNIASGYNQQYVETISRSDGVFPLYDFRSHIVDNCPETIHVKGASVLNMLRHVMGDAAFYAGLREYTDTYRSASVNSELFRSVMQKHTAADLTQFLEQWVYGEGWPVYKVSRFCEDPDGPFRLCVRQEQAEYGWPLFAMPLEVEFVTCAGDTMRCRRDAHAAEQEMIVFDEVMDKNVTTWRLDPDGWLMKQVTAVSGVAAPPAAPSALRLDALYPHPLRSGFAVLTLQLRSESQLRIELRDLLGRRIALLHDAALPEGTHDIPLNLPSVAAGCYHLVASDGMSSTMRAVVLR